MTTFLRIVETLLSDPTEKAAYSANPDVYLRDQGFGSFDGNDVEQALVHALDVLPPSIAETVDPSVGLESVAAIDWTTTDDLDANDAVDPFGSDPGFDTDDIEQIEEVVDALDAGDVGHVDEADTADAATGTIEQATQAVESGSALHGEEEIDASESLESLTDIDFDMSPPPTDPELHDGSIEFETEWADESLDAAEDLGEAFE